MSLSTEPITMQAVYMILCVANNKVYIGSSAYVQKRLNRHKNDLRKGVHHSAHLQRAWCEHGEESFKFDVVEYVLCREDLLSREQHWIDKYNSSNRESGYNMYSQAGSAYGYRHTEASRLQMSLAQIGKKIPEEVKAKMGSKGSLHPQSVLSETDVITIKELLVVGHPQADLARRYGVSRTTICEIACGKTWVHVKVNGVALKGKVSTVSCKLTPAQVERIKQCLCVGGRGTITRLAKEFGVGFSTIADIHKGKTWTHV